jgi:arylsulfatase A-like enzyme
MEGARTTVPYLNIDLLPTLTSVLGLEPPLGIDGLDLRAPFPAPRTRVVTSMSGKKRLRVAVEQGGRKLIQFCYPEYREELYDLATDPGEQANIVLDHPGVANTLSDALIRVTHAEPCQLILNAMSGKAPEEMLSPEQIEQLKSLGYIQ